MNTSSNSIAPPLTIDVLMDAIKKLKAIPKNDKWLVVDPEGNIYKGTVEQVLPLLVKRHPLFNSISYFNKEIVP